LPWSFVTSHPGTVSGSVVEAIFPSRETRIGMWGAMCSTRSACAKNASMRRSTAALLAPAWSLQTT
jgi:hypothetical protein